MGPVLLGLAAAAAVLAVPFASRRLRPARAARAAVPAAVIVRPSGEMPGPFAYDNGVAVETEPGEGP